MPPLTGVAVKVTEPPEQFGLLPDVIAILTDGITVLFTVMVIPVDVTVNGLAQLRLEVMVQVNTSPSVMLLVVKFAEVAPATGDPLRFH